MTVQTYTELTLASYTVVPVPTQVIIGVLRVDRMPIIVILFLINDLSQEHIALASCMYQILCSGTYYPQPVYTTG